MKDTIDWVKIKKEVIKKIGDEFNHIIIEGDKE